MAFATDARLGSQIWLQPDDSRARVDALVTTAAAIGLGQLRTFLMWPWIQRDSPREWSFEVFDRLFDAAAEHGLSVKATLTANSGPWWLGTPSVLHSHTLILQDTWWPAVEAYVRRCAERYSRHPGLGQWILWNEPMHPGPRAGHRAARPSSSRPEWAEYLAKRHGDISVLNERWRTGYTSFEEVPPAEEVTHPAHRDSRWRSFGPELCDADFRAQQLEDQLARIARLVRETDPGTPICLNPSNTLQNHAWAGYRLPELARTVDVLGASFHAPWHLVFAEPDDHPALVTAGVSLLRGASAGAPVEVTELQTGNTFYAGARALGTTPATLAASHLAPLLAGASSVTGWCLNTRSEDFEAGEWGLLDDLDQPGERAGALSRVRDLLAELDARLGDWQPAAPAAAILVSASSQAVELALAQRATNEEARDPDVGIRGSALVVAELARLGVGADLLCLRPGWAPPTDGLLVASGHLAWDVETAALLLDHADRGGTVLVDATSGQFDPDASLHRPWPGGLAARWGLRSRGLETDPAGRPRVPVHLDGHPHGDVSPVRSAVQVTDPSWSADQSLVFGHDSRPLLWQRRWGAGRVLYCALPLGHTLLRQASGRAVVASVLSRAAEGIRPACRPLSPATSLFEVQSPAGRAFGLFAPPSHRRGGSLAASVAPGRYTDLWSGVQAVVGPDRVWTADPPDGIAVLVEAEQHVTPTKSKETS